MMVPGRGAVVAGGSRAPVRDPRPQLEGILEHRGRQALEELKQTAPGADRGRNLSTFQDFKARTVGARFGTGSHGVLPMGRESNAPAAGRPGLPRVNGVVRFGPNRKGMRE